MGSRVLPTGSVSTRDSPAREPRRERPGGSVCSVCSPPAPSPQEGVIQLPACCEGGTHFQLSLLKAVCTVGIAAWGTDSQAAVDKTLLGASLSGALWPFREGCLANEDYRGAGMEAQ